MNALLAYLDLTVGGDPDALAEVRWRLRDGRMGREFHPVRDRCRLAALLAARGRSSDTYLGVAPRARQAGGRDAVERLHVLYADEVQNFSYGIDFPTILASISEKLGKLPGDTVVYTGHGDSTTIGDEVVHYDEWVARGH